MSNIMYDSKLSNWTEIYLEQIKKMAEINHIWNLK